MSIIITPRKSRNKEKIYLSPVDITEKFCIRFRTHLLKKLSGKSPSDYFQAFKRVIKTAWKESYFLINLAEDAKAKKNPSKTLREFLTAEEYIKLLQTSIYNQNVKEAFLVLCYTGLRWCDVKTKFIALLRRRLYFSHKIKPPFFMLLPHVEKSPKSLNFTVIHIF